VSNRTLIILLVVVGAGVGAFFLFRRQRVAQMGPMNGTIAPPAYALPEIPPPPGSAGSGGGFTVKQGVGLAAGAAATAYCHSQGGGPLCGVAGSVGQKAGTIAYTAAGKVGGAVKGAASAGKKLLGKLF
jgi:hypothetical protein